LNSYPPEARPPAKESHDPAALRAAAEGLCALKAAAEGLCALKAATGLIIAHGTWLARGHFPAGHSRAH
jgi:hypothetical protein